MKIDIILAGVGGQGILSIATIVGYAAVKRGMYMKQAEVHGMSSAAVMCSHTSASPTRRSLPTLSPWARPT